jgi:peptidoglycan/xylan/chitin deacetylase (PgdA/CDA1 family)
MITRKTVNRTPIPFPYTLPTIIFTFDDNQKTLITTSYPLLKKYNMPCTIFINSDWIGAMSTSVQISELTELYEDGCCIANHTRNHSNLSLLTTEDDLMDVISPSIEWLLENGFERTAYYIGYPYGQYNVLCDTLFPKLNLIAGRNSVGYVSFPIQDKYNIPYQVVNKKTSLESAKNYVDYVLEHNTTVFLVFHDIQEDPSSSGWYLEHFEEFIKYVYQSGVKVRTFDEFWNGLTQIRYRSQPVVRNFVVRN